MITRENPDSLQALQVEVGRILSECGFIVEVVKRTQSATGVGVLDVYADNDDYAIACKCKYVKSRIPQAEVDGFRTVMREVGARFGYIISMEDFQSGTLAAADLMNLRLVTWQEFQDQFETSWFESYFIRQIDKKLGELMTYAEPFLPAWFDSMTKEDQATFLALKEKYDLFGIVMQSLTSMGRNRPIPLPLRARLKPDRILLKIPDHILDEMAYRELIDASISHGEQALCEFQALRDKYVS